MMLKTWDAQLLACTLVIWEECLIYRSQGLQCFYCTRYICTFRCRQRLGVMSSISTLNLVMFISYWTITLLLEDPFYTNATRPHTLDDIIVHAFFYRPFFHAAFVKAYHNFFVPLLTYFAIYAPMFILTRPYPFVSSGERAVVTLTLTLTLALIIHLVVSNRVRIKEMRCESPSSGPRGEGCTLQTRSHRQRRRRESVWEFKVYSLRSTGLQLMELGLQQGGVEATAESGRMARNANPLERDKLGCVSVSFAFTRAKESR